MTYLRRLSFSSALRRALAVLVIVMGLIALSLAGRLQNSPVLSAGVSIDFEDLAVGGPGGAAVYVTDQYASRGVTFNGPAAFDYSQGSSAIPGFAHSPTKAIEACNGLEFCTLPIEMSFSQSQARVKVWV